LVIRLYWNFTFQKLIVYRIPDNTTLSQNQYIFRGHVLFSNKVVNNIRDTENLSLQNAILKDVYFTISIFLNFFKFTIFSIHVI